MKFQRERAVDVMDDIKPLLEEHWREIAHYHDIQLDPDYMFYADADNNGMIRVFTARDDGNKLVGYSIFFVRPNIHYKQSLQAVQDILFITKGRRGMGARFIKWCDEQLASEGVQVVYHHIKSAHNFGPMLERMGYQLVDLIFAKRLD